MPIPDIRGFIENKAERSSWDKFWRGVRISWTVIRGLLYLALVVIAITKFSSSFETVVVCIAILIFQTVEQSSTEQARISIEEALISRGYFIGLYEKQSDAEVPEAREHLNDLGRHYKRQDIFYWINTIVRFIAYLIVLARLMFELVLA